MVKRPLLVWAVAIFYLFSTLFTLLSLYLVLGGSVPLTPEQKAYYDSLSALDYALSVAIAVTGLGGAVTLFLLRKQALYLFCFSLALNISMTVWHLQARSASAALGSPGTIGMVVGLGIVAAVCCYAWNLKRSGVLK